jgi:hypothetical protein
MRFWVLIGTSQIPGSIAGFQRLPELTKTIQWSCRKTKGWLSNLQMSYHNCCLLCKDSWRLIEGSQHLWDTPWLHSQEKHLQSTLMHTSLLACVTCTETGWFQLKRISKATSWEMVFQIARALQMLCKTMSNYHILMSEISRCHVCTSNMPVCWEATRGSFAQALPPSPHDQQCE